MKHNLERQEGRVQTCCVSLDEITRFVCFKAWLPSLGLGHGFHQPALVQLAQGLKAAGDRLRKCPVPSWKESVMLLF